MEFDTLEFVITVEERFDTSIPDADAERIQTVGDLSDYLAARARLFRDTACPTAASFYRLRRILANFRTDGQRMCPGDSVSTAIPVDSRATAWETIREEFGTALPSLRWPSFVTALFLAYLSLVIAAHTFLCASFVGSIHLVLLLGFCGSLFGVAGYVFADRFACVVPQSVSTVGDLAHLLVSQCYLSVDSAVDDIDAWIYASVVDCVCLCSDLSPELVSRNTNFVRDLY